MSKELKALQLLEELRNTSLTKGNRQDVLQGVAIIWKAASEIIKKKEVDIYGIKNSIDVYDYNAGIENESNFEKRLLTQEEYELLKKVL